MAINTLDANNAYANALQQAKSLSGAEGGFSPAKETSEGSAFSALIENSIGQVADATKTAEITSAKSIAGQADVVDVVTAVSNAEVVVSTVVGVRDKVIGAYNDIIKMPI